MLKPRRAAAAGLAALLALGMLAGCGSDEGDTGPGSAPSTADASSATDPASYLEVPEGVELTEPGTALALGEEGVVAWQLRQDDVAALAVTVERVERTSFQESFRDWNVDDVTAARTPYFVRVKVTNLSESDLGGVLLENVLWADDGTTLEAPTHYPAEQQPLCAGGPLPSPFVEDATAELCQTYFIAPGRTLESITFRPPGDLPAVTWTGEVSKVKPPAPEKPKKRGKASGQTPAATATTTP